MALAGRGAAHHRNHLEEEFGSISQMEQSTAAPVPGTSDHQKAKQLEQLRRFLIPVIVKRSWRKGRQAERMALQPCPPYRADKILKIMLQCGPPPEAHKSPLTAPGGDGFEVTSNAGAPSLGPLIPTWPEALRMELLKGSPVKYKLPGEILIHTHEPSTIAGVILLLCGTVAFTHHPHEHEGPGIRTVTGPAILGEDWAATDSPSPCFVVTTTPADVVLFNYGTFHKLAYHRLNNDDRNRFEQTYMVKRQQVMEQYFPQTPPLMRLCWICSEFPPRALDKLIANLKAISFMPGKTVVAEGTYSPYMYFLRRGEVAIHVRGQDTGARLHPGMSFGENSFLFGEKRSASVVTLTPVDVWALHSRTIKVIFQNDGLRQAIINKAALRRRIWLGDQKRLANNPLREILKKIPCLAHSCQDTRDRIVECSHPLVFPSGTIITSTSEMCDGIYVMVNGFAKSQIKLATGDATEYDGAKKDFFGDWCLVPHRWPYSIAASTMVETWFLKRSDVRRALEHNNEYEESKELTRTEVYHHRRKNGPESLLLGGTSHHLPHKTTAKLTMRQKPTKVFVTPDKPSGPVPRAVLQRNKKVAARMVKDDYVFTLPETSRPVDYNSPRRGRGNSFATQESKEDDDLQALFNQEARVRHPTHDSEDHLEESPSGIQGKSSGSGGAAGGKKAILDFGDAEMDNEIVRKLATAPSFAHKGFLTSLKKARTGTGSNAFKKSTSTALDKDLFTNWSIEDELSRVESTDGPTPRILTLEGDDSPETAPLAPLDPTVARYQATHSHDYACQLPPVIIKQQQAREATPRKMPENSFIPTVSEAETMMDAVFRYSVKETIEVEDDEKNQHDEGTDFLEEALADLYKPKRASSANSRNRNRQVEGISFRGSQSPKGANVTDRPRSVKILGAKGGGGDAQGGGDQGTAVGGGEGTEATGGSGRRGSTESLVEEGEGGDLGDSDERKVNRLRVRKVKGKHTKRGNSPGLRLLIQPPKKETKRPPYIPPPPENPSKSAVTLSAVVIPPAAHKQQLQEAKKEEEEHRPEDKEGGEPHGSDETSEGKRPESAKSEAKPEPEAKKEEEGKEETGESQDPVLEGEVQPAERKKPTPPPEEQKGTQSAPQKLASPRKDSAMDRDPKQKDKQGSAGSQPAPSIGIPRLRRLKNGGIMVEQGPRPVSSSSRPVPKPPTPNTACASREQETTPNRPAWTGTELMIKDWSPRASSSRRPAAQPGANPFASQNENSRALYYARLARHAGVNRPQSSPSPRSPRKKKAARKKNKDEEKDEFVDYDEGEIVNDNSESFVARTGGDRPGRANLTSWTLRPSCCHCNEELPEEWIVVIGTTKRGEHRAFDLHEPCESPWRDARFPRCAGCSKLVEKGGVTTLKGKPYHPKCAEEEIEEQDAYVKRELGPCTHCKKPVRADEDSLVITTSSQSQQQEKYLHVACEEDFKKSL